MASKLVGLKLTVAEIADVFGVKPKTVESWKKRYPTFKKACEAGKQVVIADLCAAGIRHACGYDYVEQTFERKHNPETGEYEMVLVKEVPKHQPANGNLLQYFLNNFDSEFVNTRKVQIDERKVLAIEDRGKLEEEQIKQLAGGLLEALEKRKQVESKEIDAA